jgi:hypothetical protein
LIEQFSLELERLKGNLAGDPAYDERLKNFEKLFGQPSLPMPNGTISGTCLIKYTKVFLHGSNKNFQVFR